MTIRFLILAALLFPMCAFSQVKILPIGDSITRGAQAYDFYAQDYPESAYRLDDSTIPNNLRSYREHLHDLLTETSCNANIEWVGGEIFPNRLPQVHEGHGGWRANNVQNRIPSLLVQHNPNVVLLNIGTNDLLQASSAQSTEQDLINILNSIDNYEVENNVSVDVYLGNMIPIVGWHATNDKKGNPSDVEAQRLLLTELLENLIVSRASLGDKIHLVDVNSEFYIDEADVTNCRTDQSGNPNNMSMTRCQPHLPPNSPDGVHPNLLGDRFIAERFATALEMHGKICSNVISSVIIPAVTIDSPLTQDQVIDSNIVVSGTADDSNDVSLQSVLVYIRDRSNKNWYNIAVPAELIDNPDSTISWEYKDTLPPGKYTVFVKSRDYSGRDSVVERRRFTIKSDVPTPIPSINNPMAHDVVLSSDTVFTGTVMDTGASEITDVLINIRNRDEKSWHTTAAPATLEKSALAGTDWSYRVSLPAGNYALFVKSVDDTGSSSEQIRRRFSIQ